MPRLNRVFEEMGIKYGDRNVPSKILKSIEEKASKAAAATNTTACTESKKRKAAGVRKAPSKKHRVAGSSRAVTTGSDEGEAESMPVGADAALVSAEVAQTETSATGEDANLMVSAL